jgi:hypothetical protein
MPTRRHLTSPEAAPGNAGLAAQLKEITSCV